MLFIKFDADVFLFCLELGKCLQQKSLEKKKDKISLVGLMLIMYCKQRNKMKPEGKKNRMLKIICLFHLQIFLYKKSGNLQQYLY